MEVFAGVQVSNLLIVKLSEYKLQVFGTDIHCPPLWSTGWHIKPNFDLLSNLIFIVDCWIPEQSRVASSLIPVK